MAKDKKKLSHSGLLRVEERLKERGWKKSSHKVCEETLKFGESKEGQTFAIGCGHKTWEKFVKREAIKTGGFNLFCQPLDLDPAEVAHNPEIDWGQAPDLETFYGRGKELADLKKLIVEDKPNGMASQRCRLISIVGFAGIGKTKLSLKLAHQVKEEFEEEFEYIIWRKLYGTLPLESLLKELIKIVSDDRETELASTTEGLKVQLLHYLKERRCLLIFDEIESIWHGDRAGGYREEYEDFFRHIGSCKHSSCVLLTSRVKFSSLERMEGSDAVRSLELKGLDPEAGQEIFQDIGRKLNCEFQGTEEDWQHLMSAYEGNPLALQFVAFYIHDIYGDNLAEFFLKEELKVLEDIKQLFNWHFERLTPDEQTIMYWLALNREGMSMDKLREYLVWDREKTLLLQTLYSLKKKIPIERSEDRWSLHPLLMEYTTERVIKKVGEEIRSGRLELFNSHALIQASAKDYIKEDQIDLIVKPIIGRLKKSSVPEPQNSPKNRLPQLLKNSDREIPGYTAGNLINLMRYVGIDLSRYDFSGMTIWEADLQDVDLYGVNFAYCKIDNCSFSQIIDSPHAIALHPKQNLIAVAERINGIKLYSLEDWQLYLDLDQSEVTKELVFSPNGNFIVSISGGRTVEVWNTDTGECRYRFTNGQQIESIAFAPDNQTVAIASKPAIVPTSETDSARSENHTISLWNIQTDEYQIIRTECCDIRSIAFHPQKNLLAGIEKSQLFVWNTDTEELLCIFDFTERGHIFISSFISAFDFHPSEEILAIGHQDGTIELWDINTRECLKTFDDKTEAFATCSISFSGDGTTIISVHNNGTTKLWDVNTGECLKTFEENIEPFALGYINRSHCICIKAPNKYIMKSEKKCIIETREVVETWKASTLSKGVPAWKNKIVNTNTTAFSPQKNILAIYYATKVFKLLNVKTGKWLKTRQFHSSDINKISISSDGQYLASHSKDNTIRLLNIKLERLSTWRLNHLIDSGLFGAYYTVYFSPDCQTLVILTEDSVIKLFDVRTGQEQKTFNHLLSTSSHFSSPEMKFSPDSNLLGCYSINSSEIILWDLKTKKMLRSIKTKINSEMNSMSTFRILFSQNNQYLANLSENFNIRDFSRENFQCSATSIVQIWDIKTGERHYNFDLPNVFDPREFDIMAFHPNDRVLVCHDRSENEILLLNFQTGEFRSTLKVHEAEVRGVFFDSEANICIVTTINTTIEIRKVGTNEPIQVLEGHTSDIKGVDFTPDGRRLVSYDTDDNIYVWNIETGNFDRRGCLEMPYNGMNIAGVEGLTPAQKAALIAQGAVETWVSDD